MLVRPLLAYSHEGGAEIELLNALTKPLTKLIIQLDDSVMDDLASGHNDTSISMIKRMCEGPVNSQPCVFLFSSTTMPDWAVGLILVIMSLTVLCFSLFVLVKLLNSIFFGRMASYIKKFINTDFPGYGKYFTGYLFILVIYWFG